MFKRALLLGLVLSSLICSGYSYVGKDSHVRFDVAEDYIEDTEEYGAIKLDGKCFKLPCMVKLFIDLGYSVGSEVDLVLPAESESYGVRLYDDKGRELTLFVRNDEAESRAIENCVAWSVRYQPLEDKEYGCLDFSICGVTPDANEGKMIEKFGLPGHSMEFDGVKYVMWYSTKDEYAISVDYNKDEIVNMQLTCDVPSKELRDAVKIAYDLYDEPDVVRPSGTGSGKGWVLVAVLFAGIPFVLIVGGVIVILLLVRSHHKRRMAEIDLAILNTPLEEMPDSLEEKYKT